MEFVEGMGRQLLGNCLPEASDHREQGTRISTAARRSKTNNSERMGARRAMVAGGATGSSVVLRHTEAAEANEGAIKLARKSAS